MQSLVIRLLPPSTICRGFMVSVDLNSEGNQTHLVIFGYCINISDKISDSLCACIKKGDRPARFKLHHFTVRDFGHRLGYFMKQGRKNNVKKECSVVFRSAFLSLFMSCLYSRNSIFTLLPWVEFLFKIRFKALVLSISFHSDLD